MTKTITLDKSWHVIRRLFLLLEFVLLAVVIAFCSFYLVSTHDRLVQWYLHLNNCFYQGATWGTDFFTPGIKSDGNMYCAIGLAIALGWLIYFIKRYRHRIVRIPVIISFNGYNIIPVTLCIVAATAFWQWGNITALPAYDEVFSAQNAAGIHPFQCISYYMLPNNHLLYNFLNGVLFHAASDKVFTGRLISLFVYYAFVIAVFFWFKGLLQNRWLALLVSITLSLQFFVWGFSFQARGYELYLLAEWGMFISLFCYIFTSHKRWLYINIFSIPVGYFCLPSFLYFHATQVVFMLLYMLCYKKKEAIFWKYQLAAILLTYLCYLPALSFSGLAAIVYNKYVGPMATYKTAQDFWHWGYPYFIPYIPHIFSGSVWKALPISYILFLAPVLLLLARKHKINVLFGMFYACLWIVFLVAATAMKRIPFERNLIGHYSITLAGIIWLAYWLTGAQAQHHKINIPKWVLFPVVLLCFAIHFLCTNPMLIKGITLYEYDVNKSYNEINEGLNYLPPGSNVTFTEDAFYAMYIYGKKGNATNKCDTTDKEYLVNQGYKPLPPQWADKYTSVNKGNEYEIYKKK